MDKYATASEKLRTLVTGEETHATSLTEGVQEYSYFTCQHPIKESGEVPFGLLQLKVSLLSTG